MKRVAVVRDLLEQKQEVHNMLAPVTGSAGGNGVKTATWIGVAAE